MSFDPRVLSRAALFLSAGAAVAVLFSIAVSHILLAAALLTLLAGRIRLRIPPLHIPLALFFLGTVAALAASPDPRAGLPQLKKFFVYLVLVVIFTTVRRLENVRQIVLAWAVIATASGLWSFVQFWHKRSEALAHGWNFYLHYVGERATGFMSHWMTFSAEQMMASLMLGSFLLFGGFTRYRRWLWISLIVIAASLVVAWTRSVWFGAAGGACYLIAIWRPKLLLLAPVVGGIVLAAGPRSIRERVISIYRPHGQVDSNDHRRVTTRTGWEMVKAHPWLGLGPEVVGRDFDRYVPPDIPRPLPSGFYGHLHNVYLQYAAERGIFTLAAFLWFLGKVVIDLGGAARRCPREAHLRRAVLHGAVAGVIAILLEGFFELNLGDSEVLTMFLTVVAAGYVARDASATAPADEHA